MSLPEFLLRDGMTIGARAGRDVLCRIRDCLIDCRDKHDQLPACVAVTTETRDRIREFWMHHFPGVPTADLPLGMMGVPFIVRDGLCVDAPFALGFQQPAVH